MTTLAPRPASWRATASPMPEAPPVTIAEIPLSSMAREPRQPAGGPSKGAEVAQGGGPQPPPPGVRIRTTSPASSSIVTLVGQPPRHRLSSPPGSSQFSPDRPGPPPSRPHGDDCRRSVISESVAASSTSRSRSMPSPPGWRPGAAAARAAVAGAAPAAGRRARAPRRACCGCWSSACARPLIPPSVRSAALPAGQGLVVDPPVVAHERCCSSSPARRRRRDPERPGPARPRQTSATRWLTSTLPAPTAAGATALTSEPSGRHDVHRTQHPAVGRERRIGGGAHGEGHRADGDRLDRVDVAGALRCRAGEVEGDLVAGHGHRRPR